MNLIDTNKKIHTVKIAHEYGPMLEALIYEHSPSRFVVTYEEHRRVCRNLRFATIEAEILLNDIRLGTIA